MTSRLVSALAVLCMAAMPASAGPPHPPADAAMDARQVPMEEFRTAARLFGEGRRDEAVFWFYLGQLRFRVYCKAHPDLDPSGAPALLSSLLATVGPSIDHYAYGDIPALNRTIDRVLAWDDAHPDAATPKERFAAERASVRRGLVALRDDNRARTEQIRAERTMNGLENRE